MKKKALQLAAYIILIGVLAGAGKVMHIYGSIGELFKDIHISAEVLLRIVITAMLVLAICKAVTLILGLISAGNSRARTLLTISESMLKYAAVIIIICCSLNILGLNVSTIIASVGILALIVGFGAESLIEDVITGFFMIVENQYNVGDIIEVKGFRGTVSSIGIRTTCITDGGGNVKIINNSNMKDILNRSDHNSRVSAEIDIPYTADLEALELLFPQMMEDIYALHTDKMKNKPMYLGVSELGSSGVRLKFAVEVSEKDIYSAQRIMNRELYLFFRRANVEIPYPQLDIHQK